MIFIRRRAVVVVALAIMVFSVSVSILSGIRSAPSSFAGDSEFLISDTSAPTIFSSRVSVDLVSALEEIPNVTSASPEVFAFANWNGESFIVRGMGEGFGPGTISLNSSDALIGHRLLNKLGFALPYQLPLTGSFSSSLELVNITGSVDTGSSMDDELLVSMDVARELSDTPEGQASIIRVSTTSPEWLQDLLSPETPRFTLFDLHCRSQAALGQSFNLSVGVRNWGSARGSQQVTFSDNGSLLATLNVTLNRSSSVTLTLAVTLDVGGVHNLAASIAGDFPVVLTTNVTVVPPYLRVSAPARATLGSQFNATVLKFDGLPAAGASVSFENQTIVCNAQGVARMSASIAGSHRLYANLTGYAGDSAVVDVLDPSAYPPSFSPSISSFTLSPTSIKQNESSRGLVTLENDGTVAGYYDLRILVDGAPYLTMNVSLDSMASRSVTFKIEDLQPGEHTVQVGSYAIGLSVQPWYADNPGLVQLVIRYGGTTSLVSSASIPIYQAVKVSQGTISIALFSTGAISAVLAAMAIISVFSKEIRQSRQKFGVLRTIGAPRAAIRRLVFPQAMLIGMVGALIGIGLGVLTVDLLAGSSLFEAFGHELSVEVNFTILVVILAAAVLIGLASAMASMIEAVNETAIASIKNLEPEAPEALDITKILGNE